MRSSSLFLALTLLFAASTGCSRSADPAYYALQVTPGTSTTVRGLKIELRRPSLPRYLDRSQIVRRASGERLELSSDDRWGAPLDEMVAGTLASDLAQRLPNCVVFSEGGPISVSPDVLVEVELTRFEQSYGGPVELSAQIALRWADSANSSRLSHQSFTSTEAPSDTSTAVAALSGLLAQLADSIASQIAAGAPPSSPPLGAPPASDAAPP